MKEDYITKILVPLILLGLLVLTFFLMKPFLLAIFAALFLAFIFYPVYNKILKIVKSKNLAAGIVCAFLVLIIVIPLWFLVPMMISQAFKVYLSTQQFDFVTPLQNVFPSLSSEQFSGEIGAMLQKFTTKITNSLVNFFSNFVFSLPSILLQALVSLFIFFFVLRDKEELMGYVRSLSPFSHDVEKKLFNSSREVTIAVIYGQVIVGVIMGLIIGIGFFIFKVPNALFLTFISIIVGVLPIIGTSLVWIPVAIYLLFVGDMIPLIGIVIIGIVSSNIDNVLRPLFVSKRTKINSGLIFIGMLGGALIFGMWGFILGPLIISYLLVLLEIYRDKKGPSLIEQRK